MLGKVICRGGTLCMQVLAFLHCVSVSVSVCVGGGVHVGVYI